MNRFWMLLSLCAGVAGAADGTVRLAPTTIEMPTRIGPLTLASEPHKFDPPALGYGYQYDGAGLRLTVYVYDMGLADIPDGGDTPATCMQFEQAKSDVARGPYKNITLKSQQLVRLAQPDDAPLAREALFEMEVDGTPMFSYLWITGVKKHFVKMRFSLDARLREEVPDARRAVLSTLGAAIKPHLAPVDTQAEKPGNSTSINISSDEDDMAAGFMYLLVLSAAVDTAPERLPTCGGPYVPDYGAELAALQSMLAIDAEGAKSKFGQTLVNAQQAGFLEEFVWSDMHRDEWGAKPPDGLELRDYAKWKKKNLKRFKRPIFGEVIVDHPRPMPIEAPDAP